MLNELALIELLQRHSLLTRADVLAGEFGVRRFDRRNQNYRVETSTERHLFIKQGSAEGASGSIEREVAIYTLLSLLPINEYVGKYVVRYLGFDRCARVLLLESPPGAEDLHEYQLRIRRLPRRLAASLGIALGRLHRITQFLDQRRKSDSVVTLAPPWVCRLLKPTVRIYRDASAVNLKLIHMLQQEALFASAFARFEAEWRCESFIHGDLKLANCLTHKINPRSSSRGVKFVDWECAGFGDPRWDVASILCSYLALWVFSIPMPHPQRPDLLIGNAQFPLTAIQTALGVFIEAYVTSADPAFASAPTWIQTTVEMVAVRLVQTAYECAASQSELTAPILTLLQLALNVLANPERATTDLLGLDLANRAVRNV